MNNGTAYIISIIDYFQIFNFFKYVESSIKNNLHKKNTISCVDPVTYSERFIKYIHMLTDVEQFLSNEIKENDELNEIKEENSDDDYDDEDNILKRINKNNQKNIEYTSSFSSQSQNEFLIQ